MALMAPIMAKGIRDKLRHMKKMTDQSMSTYLNKVKNLYDNLSTNLVKPVDDIEIINATPNRLRPEYYTFIDSFHVREALSFAQFSS